MGLISIFSRAATSLAAAAVRTPALLLSGLLTLAFQILQLVTWVGSRLAAALIAAPAVVAALLIRLPAKIISALITAPANTISAAVSWPSR